MVSNSKLIAEGRRQKAEGRGQKVYYWYVAVWAVKSVLTFMATAIKFITPEILGTLER
jgi:hypothetical protein